MSRTPVLDELSHRYHLEGKPLDSVTRVIRAVWPDKQSFESAPQEKIENARIRGERTDYWCCQYAANNGVIDFEDRSDVGERLEIFDSWWNAEKPEYIAHQMMVWSDPLECCGTLDLLLSWRGRLALIDLKCTYNPEVTWPLQCGGYSDLFVGVDRGAQREWQQPIDVAGTLHLNPRFEAGRKYAGVRCQLPGVVWREYKVAEIQQHWRNTLAFWRSFKAITGKELAPEADD